MRNNNKRRRQRQGRSRRVSPIVTGVLVAALLTGTAYGLATVWQKAEDTQAGEDKPAAVMTETSPSGAAEKSPEERAYLSAPSGSAPEAESAPEPESSEPEPDPQEENPADEPEPEYASVAGREAYSYAVRDTGSMVDKSYFDDAIFFGDSLSVGIPLYGVMPNADVVAVQGVSTVTISTAELVEVSGTRVTMLEAAKQYGEKGKVYIMLGGNGLGYEKKPFIDGYREFLGLVKAQYPDAIIYIQSMLPVTKDVHLNYPSVSNEKIDEYNLAIMELARELKLHYLDVAAAMVDEEGRLPTEASPADGMHLTGPYYFKWFDYLRSHTVGDTRE